MRSWISDGIRIAETTRSFFKTNGGHERESGYSPKKTSLHPGPEPLAADTKAIAVFSRHGEYSRLVELQA